MAQRTFQREHKKFVAELSKMEARFVLLDAMLATIVLDFSARDNLTGVTTRRAGLEQIMPWGDTAQPYVTIWTDEQTNTVANYQVTHIGRKEVNSMRNELNEIRNAVAKVREWEAAFSAVKGGA